MIRIGIISPKLSLEAIERVISKNHFDCIFDKYVYQHQEEIPDIYERCKDSCDVIFCSGELGYHRLMQIKTPNKPCTFVSYEGKHFLAMALDFVIQHPDIPLNRVYCDFMGPGNHYLGIKKCLKPEYVPYCLETPDLTYENLLGRAEELWQAGKIDMVLTRATSRLDFLREKGIPFIHILPTDEMIAESIENAIRLTQLNLHSNLYKTCVLLRLDCPEEIPEQEMEYLHISMYQQLLEFRRETELEFTIQTSALSRRFRLLDNIDSRAEFPELVRRLIRHLDAKREEFQWEFRIGAGISSSSEQSLYHAENALQEAIHYGKNDGFMADAQTRELTGPLSLSNQLSYSYLNKKAAEYSKQNGIQISNLQKIAGLFSMNPRQILTAHGLSRWLNITPRSCNRILLQLINSNLIEEIEPSKPEGKGRPTKQYQFVIANCEEIFI